MNEIKHFFVVMLENRSFDHMFGDFDYKGFDASNPDQETTLVKVDIRKFYNQINLQLPSSAKVFPAAKADNVFVKGCKDPKHEFKDVLMQLCGIGTHYQGGTYRPIDCSGFLHNYSASFTGENYEVMFYYKKEKLPVTKSFSENFCVCDHWFSSMPGTTWPNRYFLHGGSSGFLDDSPQVRNLKTNFIKGFQFANHDHIFQRLDSKYLTLYFTTVCFLNA